MSEDTEHGLPDRASATPDPLPVERRSKGTCPEDGLEACPTCHLRPADGFYGECQACEQDVDTATHLPECPVCPLCNEGVTPGRGASYMDGWHHTSCLDKHMGQDGASATQRKLKQEVKRLQRLNSIYQETIKKLRSRLEVFER